MCSTSKVFAVSSRPLGDRLQQAAARRRLVFCFLEAWQIKTLGRRHLKAAHAHVIGLWFCAWLECRRRRGRGRGRQRTRMYRGRGRAVDADMPWTRTCRGRGRGSDADASGHGRSSDADVPNRERTRMCTDADVPRTRTPLGRGLLVRDHLYAPRVTRAHVCVITTHRARHHRFPSPSTHVCARCALRRCSLARSIARVRCGCGDGGLAVGHAARHTHHALLRASRARSCTSSTGDTRVITVPSPPRARTRALQRKRRSLAPSIARARCGGKRHLD